MLDGVKGSLGEPNARDVTLVYEARLTEIERYRPKRGRLLDVGCATGVLIEQALARGWKAEGL